MASYLARHKYLKKYEYAFHHIRTQHIDVNFNDYTFIIQSDVEKIKYRPYSTTLKFHQLDNEVKLILGPFGSGKSSACCAEILFQAMQMPPNKKGIRQSKWMVIRSTAGELETTSARTWLTWTEELGIKIPHVKPYLRYEYQFNDGKGLVELEILFIPIATLDDVRKLRSFDITAAWINEASEIPRCVFDYVDARTGRFPDRFKLGKPYWHGVIMDSNPPDQEHWVYKLFETKKMNKYAVLHQPAGLLKKGDKYITNPKAENLIHLPDDYYLKMAEGKNEEFIKVYCMGEYGITFDGKLIFSEFNPDFHCQSEIEPNPDYPLLIGWDFGLTPACLICQIIDGKLHAIKEFVTERSGIRQLAEDIVIPYLNRFFQDFDIEESIGDPASLTKGSEIDLINPADILSDLGIETISAPSNEIVPRINAIKWFLNKLVDGQPAFILSEKGCPILKKAFLQKYYFKRIQRIKNEEVAEIPIKLHPFSDIMDCLQYIALYYIGTFEDIEDNTEENEIDLLSENESEWC